MPPPPMFDPGELQLQQFIVGTLVMLVIGNMLFYQARGFMKAGIAWLFAIAATALISLPVALDGSWTWAVTIGGMAALAVWLWRVRTD